MFSLIADSTIIRLRINPGLSYGWLDFVHDGIQILTRHLFSRTCGIHRATFLLLKHGQQRTVDVVDSILDAPQCDGVSNVAGHPHHKDVAQGLVEDQLRTNPAVGA